MSIFNSLGSNYTFSFALRTLCARSGPHHQELVSYLEKRYLGRAFLTYKGREAIELALNILDLPAGSKVAITGFTCYAVYKAVENAGLETVYLDVDRQMLNFSPETLETAMDKDPSIKVAIIQNTLGYASDNEKIAAICKKHGAVIIEDLAHAIGLVYSSGKEAGTIGDFAALSFSQDKVVDGVTGGALIVRNPAYHAVPVPKLRIFTSQQLKDRWYPFLTVLIRATHRSGLGKAIHVICKRLKLLPRPLAGGGKGDIRALPGWYAGIILHQFERLPKALAHRKTIAAVYEATLSPKVRRASDTRFGAIHLRFPVLVSDRRGLVDYLGKQRIFIADTWYDAPVGPATYTHLSNYTDQCPNGQEVADTIVNLPTHISISEEQARRVAQKVNEWLMTAS